MSHLEYLTLLSNSRLYIWNGEEWQESIDCHELDPFILTHGISARFWYCIPVCMHLFNFLNCFLKCSLLRFWTSTLCPSLPGFNQTLSFCSSLKLDITLRLPLWFWEIEYTNFNLWSNFQHGWITLEEESISGKKL